jgi:hypothetical protein
MDLGKLSELLTMSLALPPLPSRCLEALAVLVLGHLFSTPFSRVRHSFTSLRSEFVFASE